MVIQSQWYEPPTACENWPESEAQISAKMYYISSDTKPSLKTTGPVQITFWVLWLQLELIIPFTFAVYFHYTDDFALHCLKSSIPYKGLNLTELNNTENHPYVRLDIIINVTQKHAKFGVTQSQPEDFMKHFGTSSQQNKTDLFICVSYSPRLAVLAVFKLGNSTGLNLCTRSK